MARKARKFDVFSLSFLDCMCCGFGAVVLLLVIINSQVAVRAQRSALEDQGETSRVEELVLEGRKDLVRLRNTFTREKDLQALVAGETARAEEALARLRADLDAGREDAVARRESPEQLQADIRQLEEANRRLAERAAASRPDTGQRVRSFVGDGNRQYLTGIRMGGSHVLILLDASASMLGRTYVNVVRFRSMADDRKRRAPKWRQAVNTVDWLTTQVKPGTRVQIYTFNEQARSVVDGTDGQWITVTDGATLDAAMKNLRRVVPGKGTSLINAFDVVKRLDPQPDNIFLITDGLPTQGEKAPAQAEDVKQERRVKFMVDAVRSLPRRLPVNVLLLPMDGDPQAAGYFWELAVASGGSLLTPSRDWP